MHFRKHDRPLHLGDPRRCRSDAGARARGGAFFAALAATFCASTFAPFPATAAPVTVVNHSFEDPVLSAGVFDTSAPPPGWSGYGTLDFGFRTIGALNPSGTTLYPGGAPDGDNVGVAFLGLTHMNSEAGLEQTLAATLEAGTRYTLTVEVGNIANDVTFPHSEFEFGGFPGYRIDLLAGGVVIASDDDTLLPPEGEFLTSVVEVDIDDTHPNLGEPIGIRLVNLDAAEGIEVNFDNVRLDAEPLDAEPLACPDLPPLDCLVASTGGSGLALGRREGLPAKSNLGWSWKGGATDLADFGSPVTEGGYRFCLYDGAGDIVADLEAPAAGDCGGKPCWKSGSKGFRYKDSSATPDGVLGLVLKAGPAGKALVKLKAKGANLAVPALPLMIAPDPVVAVLLSEGSGVCWDAAYPVASSKPDSETKWKAASE